MDITFTHETRSGLEIEHTLPAKFLVCECCDGHGTHLHEAIGSHAYTSEEFDEAFSDDEEREHYFKHGGKYDVRCEECKGERVVKVVDEEACERAPRLRRRLALYIAVMKRRGRFESEYAAICAAERRMGA